MKDETILSEKILDMKMNYKFINLYNYDRFYKYSMEYLKPLIRLAKKVKLQLVETGTIDLMEPEAGQYYQEAILGITHWCHMFNFEFKGISVSGTIQVRTLHTGTKERYLLWIKVVDFD